MVGEEILGRSKGFIILSAYRLERRAVEVGLALEDALHDRLVLARDPVVLRLADRHVEARVRRSDCVLYAGSAFMMVYILPSKILFSRSIVALRSASTWMRFALYLSRFIVAGGFMSMPASCS